MALLHAGKPRGPAPRASRDGSKASAWQDGCPRARLEIVNLGHGHFAFAPTFDHELTERTNHVCCIALI
jgi:hypothetical protein